MRKLILAMSLMFSSLVHAEYQTEKTIVCDSADRIYKYFTNDPYNEMPVWMGKDVIDPSIQYTLLANYKTGTWTIIMIKDKTGCVLGAGTKHTLVLENLGERI